MTEYIYATHIQPIVGLQVMALFPTNKGLLLNYQSQADNRYKRSLIRTMLDRPKPCSGCFAGCCFHSSLLHS